MKLACSQAPGERIGEQDRVTELAGHWAETRNRRQTGIGWQFRTADAPTKLKYIYPKIEE